MASYRATKSGMDADLQSKMSAKWDSERAKIAMAWIARVTGEDLATDGSSRDCHEKLKNGMVLAKLANWVKPNSVPANKMGKAPSMAFKQMELIGMFLKTIDEGEGGPVKRAELFQTVDLYDNSNMLQVIVCIESLGRAMQTQGRDGFGKAESKGEAKEWTEEQLKAGHNIIGLQMGSNKGASQSGQNFGKGRHIVD